MIDIQDVTFDDFFLNGIIHDVVAVCLGGRENERIDDIFNAENADEGNTDDGDTDLRKAYPTPR